MKKIASRRHSSLRLSFILAGLGIVCLLALAFVAFHPASPLHGFAMASIASLGVLPIFGLTTSPAEDAATKALAALEDIQKSQAAQEKNWALVKELPEQVVKITTDLNSFEKQFALMRSGQLRERRAAVRATQTVSDECAANIIACCLATRLKAAGNLEAKQADLYAGIYKEITGEEWKTALASSDIPLPTEYRGEVVELVSAFGDARKYGTVIPLGTGTVNLPRMGTDPTFGLIATSGSVGEKSPTAVNVTFTPQKFGGLVRIPSELDDDSIIGLGQFIARYAARQMAYCEDWQFFRSTGAGSGLNGSVEGLCVSTITNSKVTQQASTKTKYSDATLAQIRLIRSQVDAAALGMAAYYCHPTFEQHFSGLNTAGDKPYQLSGLKGATLDGFPIRWVDAMPAYSTSANVSKVFLLFGDLSYQYLGLRGSMRFESSAEAAFATDEILVRALERMTIGLMATGAVSGLQTAAS